MGSCLVIRVACLILLASLAACAPAKVEPSPLATPSIPTRGTAGAPASLRPDLATGERFCRSSGQFVRDAAAARDRGVPRAAAVATVPEGSPGARYNRGLINMAYDAPGTDGARLEADVYAGCMDAVSGAPRR